MKKAKKMNVITLGIKIQKFLYYHQKLCFALLFVLGVIAETLLIWYFIPLDLLFKIALYALLGVGIFFGAGYFCITLSDARFIKIIDGIARKVIQYSLDSGKFPLQVDLLNEYGLDVSTANIVYSYLQNKGLLDNLIYLEKIQQRIVKEADNNGGILSINKAYISLGAPLDVIKRTFERLEKQGLIRKITPTIYDFRGIREFSDIERKLIELAEMNGGTLTLESASKELKENIEKIKTILEDFEEKGIAVKGIHSGAMVWYFPGIIKELKSNSNK